MQFTFDYETDVMTLDVYKARLRFYMNGGDIDVIDLNGYEIDRADDLVQATSFRYKDKSYTLQEIVCKAERQYPDILGETVDEIEDEIDHIRFLSSPELTGRI